MGKNQRSASSHPCPICFNEGGNSLTFLYCKQCNYGVCGDCYTEWHKKRQKNTCCICRNVIFDSTVTHETSNNTTQTRHKHMFFWTLVVMHTVLFTLLSHTFFQRNKKPFYVVASTYFGFIVVTFKFQRNILRFLTC